MPDRARSSQGRPLAERVHSLDAATHGRVEHATAAGTRRYQRRFAAARGEEFYRSFLNDLVVSSLGIGTYLGEPTTADDEAYAATVRAAIGAGVNLVDTAINYRCQRSERAVGRVLRMAIDAGQVARDELVVCTKGGFVPLDGSPPVTKEGYQGYLRREFYARGVMRPEDVVAGGHCIAPGFLTHQVQRSAENLGVGTIDLYYLHNPEQQLVAVSHAELLDRLRAAFAALERCVDEGRIAAYGCATWNGFRTPPEKRDHLSMADLVRVAREVSGEGHHLRAVQMPLNLAMPEAFRLATQLMPDGRMLTPIEAAVELGLSVVASAPLMQGRLTHGLPPQISELYPSLATDAQRALAFVRSLPISAALVGMRKREHLEDNLGMAQ